MLENWKKISSCLNYQTYVYPWATIDIDQRLDIIEILGELGTREDNDACGITTIYTSWGVVLIPPVGFPELKINFYQKISTQVVDTTLTYIAQRVTTHTRIIT